VGGGKRLTFRNKRQKRILRGGDVIDDVFISKANEWFSMPKPKQAYVLKEGEKLTLYDFTIYKDIENIEEYKREWSKKDMAESEIEKDFENYKKNWGGSCYFRRPYDDAARVNRKAYSLTHDFEVWMTAKSEMQVFKPSHYKEQKLMAIRNFSLGEMRKSAIEFFNCLHFE
jgi:hypothetical protein